MKFEGIIKHISNKVTVGKEDKQTVKVTLCLEETGDSQYPNKLAIDFMGDEKVALLDALKEGMTVEVAYNTSYNRFQPNDSSEEKIFNSIKGWRVIVLNSQAASNNSADDLPF